MADPKQLASLLSEEEELRKFNAMQGDQPWYSKALPMEGRATFLPFRDTMEGSVFNKRELALPGILAGAVNAFTSPARALTGSDPTFKPGEEAANMALNTFGGGITTGAALRNPTGLGGKDLALNVYHGTPHEIKGGFDISKVGTGEGAQSYGHGIYFGEAKGTGEQYQKTLAYKAFDLKPEAQALGIDLPAGARGEFHRQAQAHKDPEKAAFWLQSANASTRDIPKEKLVELFSKYYEKGQGNLYKADIPDFQIPMMLDFYKPLTEQTPQVRAILEPYQKELGTSFGTGQQILREIAFDRKMKGLDDSPAAVSKQLSDLGITGVRYLDDKSRGNIKAYTTYKGEKYGDEISFGTQKQLDDYIAQKKEEGFGVNVLPQTSNFVVFKPETVKILEKNGIPVTRKKLLKQEFDKLEK